MVFMVNNLVFRWPKPSFFFGGSLRPIQKIVGPVVKEGGLGGVSEINHHTVDGRNPANLGCIKPYEYWDIFYMNW